MSSVGPGRQARGAFRSVHDAGLDGQSDPTAARSRLHYGPATAENRHPGKYGHRQLLQGFSQGLWFDFAIPGGQQ